MATLPTPRPDWVVIGSPSGDGGVLILASTDLTQAQLEMERDRLEDDYWPFEPVQRLRLSPPRYTLTCEMRRYLLITAPTYAEAFARLAKEWNPDQRHQSPELGQYLAVES